MPPIYSSNSCPTEEQKSQKASQRREEGERDYRSSRRNVLHNEVTEMRVILKPFVMLFLGKSLIPEKNFPKLANF